MVLMWNVVLFGAEIGFTLQNYRHHATGGPGDWSRSPLHLGMAIMLDVARQFTRGGRTPSVETLSQRFVVGIPYLRKVIDDLVKGNILLHAGDEGEGLVPAREPEKINFGDVLSALEEGQSMGWKFGHGSLRKAFEFGENGDTTIKENAVADSFWSRGWDLVDMYYIRGRESMLHVLCERNLAEIISDLEKRPPGTEYTASVTKIEN